VKDRAFDYKFIAIEGATSKLIKTYWRSNSVLFKGKYVSEIIDFLKRNTFTEQLFFLCGNESLPDLPNYLTARKDIKWKQIQVYSNTATPQVLNINYKAILFFSPSAIKSYQIQNQFDQDTIYGCIGTTTAAYLQSVYKEAKIIMPPHPDKLELCKTIFKLMYNK
jgi:uroporphyrinogen-III synthase